VLLRRLKSISPRIVLIVHTGRKIYIIFDNILILRHILAGKILNKVVNKPLLYPWQNKDIFLVSGTNTSICQVDHVNKENITHLNRLYKNYESKASFVVPVEFPNTCNMWVVRWFHQQEHFLMKHLPFQLNLSYFTIQDNIFVSSFQRNDRIKSCHKYKDNYESQCWIPWNEKYCEILRSVRSARDQAGINDLNLWPQLVSLD
jgi:hypothetical protein